MSVFGVLGVSAQEANSLEGAQSALEEAAGFNPERALPLGEASTAAGESRGASSVFVGLRILAVLVLVAAAVYGVVFLLKRGGRRDTPGSPHLKVLAQAPLTMRTSVSVVAVGQEAWLVGSGENGASLIAAITDKETVDAMLLDAAQSAPPPAFVDFSALLRRFGAPVGNTTSQSQKPAGPRPLSQRLRGL